MSITKSLADILAIVLIMGIAVLALISIAAVWKFIEIQNIIYKTYFSLGILSVAYVISVVAARHWETHQDHDSANNIPI
ncbi:MAG: hypothetical protein AAB604_01485 [Patescibacteria group bacterium]